VNPEHFEAYMELGNILAYQGDPLALEYFETAIRLNPNSAQALYNKGMYLQAGERFDEAMKTYRELINVDKDNFLAYYNTGYIYLTEYLAFDTAMAYFDTVLTLDPTYVDAYYNKGLCFEELEQRAKAIEIYRSVLQADPQHTLAAMGMERLTE
jgi:tetratricopeptide (TPR) repeat protein